MPDRRFEEFLTEASTATWQPTEAVERRGRQRRLRQRLAVAGVSATIVAVVSAGLMLRATGTIDVAPVPPASVPPTSVDTTPSPGASTRVPSSSPSGQPSGQPSGSGTPTGSADAGPGQASGTPVTVPGMMLPTDLGGSWTAGRDEGGDWTLASVINQCEPVGQDPVAPLGSESQILRSGDAFVRQFVHRYPDRSGAAAKTADIRGRVDRCASFRSRYSGDQYTLRVVSAGFAAGADESFVVERSGAGRTGHAVFVRRGAFVTEVLVSPNDDANRRRIGQAAANRLATA
jgi:hypothetical protein